MFAETIRDWVDKEAPKAYARELELHEADYPFELWEKMTDAGFHGIAVGEEYGGQGGDIMMQVQLGRGLARSLAGLSWVWALTSFAGAKSIGIYGSDEQKERFLPSITRGELRFSIGFSEPGGGTDVLGAMKTFARKTDGGWVVNGNKTWCSSAHVADYILLARPHRARGRQAAPGSVAVPPADQGRGRGHRAIGQARHARHRVVRRRPHRRFRARRSDAGRAGQGVVHAAADAQQRAHPGRLVLPRDPRRDHRGRAGLHEGAARLRSADRPVPDPPALHRGYRDPAQAGRADALRRSVAPEQRHPGPSWRRRC